MKHTLLLLVTLLLVWTSAAPAAVYHSKSEALKLAFPDAERVETVNLYLTDAEIEKLRLLSGATTESALQTLYRGWAGERILGYAAIEAATVRTMPETVLVVLDPEGRVRFAEVLAFFEPEEYKPGKRWLDQFQGKKLSSELRIGGEIQGISGATLSAQALTLQVRKSAALTRLLLFRSRP